MFFSRLIIAHGVHPSDRLELVRTMKGLGRLARPCLKFARLDRLDSLKFKLILLGLQVVDTMFAHSIGDHIMGEFSIPPFE